MVNGIAAGRGVKLVPYMFDKHLEYLELSFMIGDTSVTIRTKKPLDADTLTDVSYDNMLTANVFCCLD